MLMHYQPAKTNKLTAENILRRDRCFEILHNASKAGIVWLAAPGGSGKSSLAASFLDAEGASCLWLKIDPGDADPANFFYYLHLAAAGSGTDIAELPEFSPSLGQDIAEYSRVFFQELFSTGTPPDYIVFDNIHEVPPESCPVTAIQAGLNRLPQHATFLVIGRTKPPPAFSRLEMNGDLVVLSAEDINFNEEEIAAYLKQKHVEERSPEVVSFIGEKTNGWAAGVRLLAEKIKRLGAAVVMDTPLHSADFFDYFSEEIFSVFNDDIRDFLLKSVIFKELEPRIVSQATGRDDAEDVLLDLASRNLFIERTAGAAPTFRHHPLFRDYLLRHVESALGAEDLRDLRRDAGNILLQHGNVEEAAELFAEAAAWGELAGVVLRHAPELMAQGRIGTLSAWLSAFPQERIEESPWLLYWSGISVLFFDFKTGRDTFRRALSHFESQNDVLGMLLSCAGILEGYVFEWKLSPMDEWLERMESLLEDRPEYPTPMVEVVVMRAFFFALILRRPYSPNMEKHVARVKKLIMDVPDPAGKMELCMALALYSYMVGRASLTIFILDVLQGFDKAPKEYPTSVRIWLDTLWGFVGATTGRCDKALMYVEDGLHIADTYGMNMFKPRLASYGIYAYLHKNDPKGAEPYFGRMLKMLENFGHMDRFHFSFLCAWREWLNERYEEALLEIKVGVEILQGLDMPHYAMEFGIFRSLILIEAGKLQEAEKTLESFTDDIEFFDSTYARYIFAVVNAVLSLKNEDDESAREWMRKAAEAGRKSNVSLVPYWQGRSILNVFLWALENDIETAFARSEIKRYGYTYFEPPVTLTAWPRPIRINTLGKFSVLHDDKEISFQGKGGNKPLQLLKVLISQGGQSVREAVVMDTLWPDADGDLQKTSLNTTLHRLRKQLKEKDAVSFRDGLLSLNNRLVWVDRSAFEAFLLDSEASEDVENSLKNCGNALGIYQGHFLEEEDAAEWAVAERERLMALHLRCVGRTAETLAEQGQSAKAADVYESALKHHPLNEGMYRALIGLHVANGENNKAKEVYERCRRTFLAEYGREPGFILSDV